MKHDIIIACDIGLHGGIAFFDPLEASHPSNGLLSLMDMPVKEREGKTNVIDLERLVYIMERARVRQETALVVFEDIHSFGNSGFGVGKVMEEKGMLRGSPPDLAETLQTYTSQRFER
jgi:hypothetical protein